MICNVIGCGESASKWDGSGDSIGVNDAFKFSHKIQNLVLLNEPHEFESGRLQTILTTNPDKVFTCYRSWSKPQYQFKSVELFNYHVWQGQLASKGKYQTSHTSPFAAISIAYNLGYDEIILWGVDFKTHKVWHNGNHNFAQEIKNYQQLAVELKKKGIMVYSSAPSVLGLPVYDCRKVTFEEEFGKIKKFVFND